MAKEPGEWLLQAEYDMDTAGAMFDSGRHVYAVFMCHLALEKALKGLYQRRLSELPPRHHNLVFFVEKLGLDLPVEMASYVALLGNVSVPTRYPDDLEKLVKDFNRERTGQLVDTGRKVLAWIKRLY